MRQLMITGTCALSEAKVLFTSQMFAITQSAILDSGAQISATRQPTNIKRNNDNTVNSIAKNVFFFVFFSILFSFYGWYTVSSNIFLTLPAYPSMLSRSPLNGLAIKDITTCSGTVANSTVIRYSPYSSS